MNLREHFEKLYPVPEGVSWSDVLDMYACEFLAHQNAEKRQNGLWQGFQDGYITGLDDALEETSQHEYAGEIAIAIAALKDQSHSANTVGGPTPVMDAAPACERSQVIKECAAACAEFVNKWNQTSIDRLQAGRTSDSLLWAGHAAGANLCHGAIMALMANCSNEDTRTAGESDS